MTHYYRQLIWIIASLLLILSNADGAASLSTQRADFVAAEKALSQGKSGRYQRLKASLTRYPLYPYLEYRELRRKLHKQKKERIQQFLTRYADTPLATRLRNVWLDHLAKRGRWQSYLAFYIPSKNVTRQCHYLHALYKSGREQEALDQVAALWRYKKSQPKACNPIFKAWQDAGMQTEKLTWQRIQLAMEAHQTRLVKYLRKFLPADEQKWVDRWLKVHRKPQVILSSKAFAREHPYRNTILLHGIKRLARKDATAALHAWRLLQDRHSFTAGQQLDIERSLAFALIRDRDPERLSFLAQIEPAADDDAFRERRIRAALEERNWPVALVWLNALPEPQRSTEGWSYWRARALEELGRPDEARRLFSTVARERSYYGFLAADRLGLGYHLANIPLQVDTALQQRVMAQEAVARARELHILGRLIEARREWELVTKDMQQDELQAAAKLAESWGWHDRAIFSLARTGYWDDLNLRFPLKYKIHIEKEASTNRLDSAWLFAVVRQESAFIQDARSSAGALGLMQLMPRTARQVAKRLHGRSLRSLSSLLLDPKLNIQLGSAYLRQVFDRLDQHPVLATAAYNAGPTRVKRWLPERDMPADLWVETVPFRETRSYLRRVLSYTVIYEQQLGEKPTKLAYRMPLVKGVSENSKREEHLQAAQFQYP